MNFFKKYKKIIIIISTILFVAIAGFIFYLLFIKDNSEDIWYDSSWSYRKSVTVETPREYRGIKEDVLLEVNTEQLIKEKKLAFDCRDLRFVDEDNSSTLRYWIEGGCNTKKTQIWVEINLSENAEKIIYMYYGNELVPDGQEDWQGEFITMSTEQCQDHWSTRERFNGKFPLADEVFGKTGGATAHNHEIFDKFQSDNCPEPVTVGFSSSQNDCEYTKDNILNLNFKDSSNIPEYENANFCGSKNGFLTKSSILLSQEKSIEGWSHIAQFDNKFVRGDDGQNPEVRDVHMHYANCINSDITVEDGDKEYIKLNGVSRTIAQQTEPPFYTLNFLRNEDGGGIPKGSIMMVTTMPPLGWEKFTDIDGKFLKGSKEDYNISGGSDIHYHIPTMDISVESTNRNRLSNIDTEEVCLFNYLEAETQSTESSILPPYITIIYGKKIDRLIANISIQIGEEESGSVLGVLQSSPTAPTDLETESITNPTSLDTLTPGFTAIFNHPDYQE